MTSYPVSHLQVTLRPVDGDLTFAITPEGDTPAKKLFTGFADAQMSAQLRRLADAIDAEVTP